MVKVWFKNSKNLNPLNELPISIEKLKELTKIVWNISNNLRTF